MCYVIFVGSLLRFTVALSKYFVMPTYVVPVIIHFWSAPFNNLNYPTPLRILTLDEGQGVGQEVPAAEEGGEPHRGRDRTQVPLGLRHGLLRRRGQRLLSQRVHPQQSAGECDVAAAHLHMHICSNYYRNYTVLVYLWPNLT